MPDSVCSAMKIIPEMSSDHCTLGGAIFLRKRSCAAPISKVERYVSDRFCAILWCIVNTYLPAETEVNVLEWGLEISSPNPVGQPRRHDARYVWTTCATPGRWCFDFHEHKIIRYSRRFSRLVQVECNKLSPSLSPRNEKQTNKRCLRPGLSHA